MDLFNLNNALITIAAVFLLAIIAPARARALLMTALALGGVVLASYFNTRLSVIYVSLSMFILLIGWLLGKAIADAQKPSLKTRITAAGLFVLFAPLLGVKIYIAFYLEDYIKIVQQYAPGFELSTLVPVGISYFSFRAAAYIIEIGKGSIRPVGLLRFINYAFFWPTLTAGPIERPGAFFEQTENLKKADSVDFAHALYRIASGFFKKAVLANIFMNIARPYIELGGGFEKGLAQFSIPHLWLCLTAYYLYLYFDFSAYSDLAIGAARAFGIKIMENFRWPILALNISDFWQRWHISLTSWVTDYVYRPLGGNRKGLLSAALFSTIAMIAVGAWHGLNLHFIIWGAYHALFLSIYRFWRKAIKPKLLPNGAPGPAPLWVFLSWALTFIVVNLGWVLFHFPTTQAWLIYKKLFALI